MSKVCRDVENVRALRREAVACPMAQHVTVDVRTKASDHASALDDALRHIDGQGSATFRQEQMDGPGPCFARQDRSISTSSRSRVCVELSECLSLRTVNVAPA